ncbi:hypothetical protein GCM10023063_15320 [Arthrobacter methylotrophus]
MDNTGRAQHGRGAKRSTNNSKRRKDQPRRKTCRGAHGRQAGGSGRQAQKNTKKKHNAENTTMDWTMNEPDHAKGEGRSPESS